jgi:DNA-binding CsgD family transcriptional regulator
MSDPTARQLEVLDAFIRHRSRKLAATELGIRDSTAAVHLRNLYVRLGVHTRDEAAAAIPQLRGGFRDSSKLRLGA